MNQTPRHFPNDSDIEAGSIKSRLVAKLPPEAQRALYASPESRDLLDQIASKVAVNGLPFDVAIRELQQFTDARKSVIAQGIQNLSESIKTLGGMLFGLADLFGDWEILPPRKVITYEDAIRYFVEHRPPCSERAAMIRERETPRGPYIFTQIYLDKNDQPLTRADGIVLGRRVRVLNLDAELHEAFGDQDIVIVE